MNGIDGSPDVGRRTLLGVLGAVPLGMVFAAGGSSAGGAEAGEAADTAKPLRAAAAVERFKRLHCAPGGGWAMWVYGGVLVGMPQGQIARPLVGIAGFSFTRMIARGEGSYDAQLDEAGYYCDLSTGRPLDRWTNPFTGREVQVEHYRSPQQTRYVGTQVLPARPLPPGVDYHGEITTLAEVSGQVAMTEDLYVRFPAQPANGDKPARPERFATSLATFTTGAANLQVDAKSWVDCDLAFGTMNSFARWLGMDDTPGIQNMRLVGRKHRATDLAAVAPWLLERVRHDHPDFLNVPNS